MDIETAKSEMQSLVTDLDSRSPDRIISTVRRRQEIVDSLESYYASTEDSSAALSYDDPAFKQYRELNAEFDTTTRTQIIQILFSQTGSADWSLFEAFTEIKSETSAEAIDGFLLASLGANIVRLLRDGMLSEVPQEYVEYGFEVPEHPRRGIESLGLCIDTPHLDFKQPFMNFVDQQTQEIDVHFTSDRIESRSKAMFGVAEILVVASLVNQKKAVQYLSEVYERVDSIDLDTVDRYPILRAQHKLNNNEHEFLKEGSPVYVWLSERVA